jgi:hypothetical protein
MVKLHQVSSLSGFLSQADFQLASSNSESNNLQRQQLASSNLQM